MRERRKFIRIPEDSPITYEIMDNPKIGDFFTDNISQGGIRFFVHHFIPVKSLLRIKFFLKKITFYFEAVVKVAWVRKVAHSDRYEIGVEFIDIPQKAAEHLIDYIGSILSYRNKKL